jgi:nitrite reductase/ring-hydroxylating ferredoxin subunit
MLLSALSCDQMQESEVPSVPFSFNINLIIDNDLTIPGNSKYYNYGGYGGVIVYCETSDTYYAYDATCTHELTTTCKVINTGVLGECKCCKSKFILQGGGYPAEGLAEAPLRQYNVSRINSSTLRIYN